MKKILALVLALTLLLSLSPAMAEDIESYYPGNWVQFEGGFEIYMPSDWVELEMTPEELESGLFYSSCSPDGAMLMQLGWAALEKETTLEELQAVFASVYPVVEPMEVNGIQMLCTGDAESNTLMFVVLDAAKSGFYCFMFAPMDIEELLAYATVIASSIRNF